MEDDLLGSNASDGEEEDPAELEREQAQLRAAMGNGVTLNRYQLALEPSVCVGC